MSMPLVVVLAVTCCCPGEKAMTLASPAFSDGQPIPIRFTGDGENVSPEFRWRNVPQGTKSFALICRDVEGDQYGDSWFNWVIFNIPAAVRALGEGRFIFNDGTVQGTNSAGLVGYLGPGPPRESEHHYVFRLYALDTVLTLDSKTDAERILHELREHVLGRAALTGTYKR